MLKELIYLGLGGALLAKDKVEKELNELVEKGKLSKDDAKELMLKAKQRGEEEEKRVKNELKKALKEAIEELSLATKDDIKRVEELIIGKK